MARTRTNSDPFPINTYNGVNVSYFRVPGDKLSTLQIQHPAGGSVEIAASIDYKAQAYADKLWTVLPLKLLGTTTFVTSIVFTDTEPTIVKFNCASYAFLRITLTAQGGGGIYRVIYNTPTSDNGEC